MIEYNEKWFNEMVEFFNEEAVKTKIDLLEMGASGDETPFYIPMRNFQLLNQYYLKKLRKYSLQNTYIVTLGGAFSTRSLKEVTKIREFETEDGKEYSFAILVEGDKVYKTVYRGFDYDYCKELRDGILESLNTIVVGE